MYILQKLLLYTYDLKLYSYLAFKSITFKYINHTNRTNRAAILWGGLRGFYITRCGCRLRIFSNRKRGLVHDFRKKPHRPTTNTPIHLHELRPEQNLSKSKRKTLGAHNRV